MKKFKFTIRGNEYEIEIKDFENNIAEVEVNGTTYKVELQRQVSQKKTPKLVRSSTPISKESGVIRKQQDKIHRVTSPLPGIILKIIAKKGDTIKKGDNLLVMEAMKMENNILADKDGTITEILVKENDNVLQGDVLVEIS